MKNYIQEKIAAAGVSRDATISVQYDFLPSAAPFRGHFKERFHHAGNSGHRSAQPARRNWYLSHGKRILDTALIVLSLPLTLPIILLCALALWIEGGQPFYWQERLGQKGRRFRIVKMRTMVRDADAQLAEYLQNDPALRAEWEATQKLKNDPRVTRVGKVLRATSVDELPQLWNVLTGKMSLVGPRPMMPEQLPLYGDASPYFAVKPGITGIWQVSVRNNNRFDYRAQVDATYLRTVTLWRDLVLMFKTLGVMARRTGC